MTTNTTKFKVSDDSTAVTPVMVSTNRGSSLSEAELVDSRPPSRDEKIEERRELRGLAEENDALMQRYIHFFQFLKPYTYF